MTDNLFGYPVARREVMPEAIHSAQQDENYQAEQLQERVRITERGMSRFKSMGQVQKILTAHTVVHDVFNLGRRFVRAEHYRDLMISAFRGGVGG